MILFLAGTSDARELAIRLMQAGYDLVATVVTDSAAASLQEAKVPYHVGRLTEQQMTELIEERHVTTVVDASHPYAEEASKTAMAAASITGIRYIRYERPQQSYVHPLVTQVETYKEAAIAASAHSGTIMLT